MKRALVLAGGGARGSYQVGMLQSLVTDQGLDFQILRGVSVGALNASFLAQAPTGSDSLDGLRRKLGELEKLWREEIRGNRSVYTKRVGGLLGLAGGANSLYSLKPLRRLLDQYVSLPALRESGRDFKAGTVSLVSGLYAEWDPKDPRFLDKLLASASIPVVFPYVETKSERDVLVDGGVRNITPLGSAFDTEPDEVYVLLTSRLLRDGDRLPLAGALPTAFRDWNDNWLGTKVNGLDVLTRTVELLTDEVYLEDIRGALSWNTILERVKLLGTAVDKEPSMGADTRQAIEAVRRSTRKRHVPIHVLAPQEWYGDKNSSTDFSPPLIAEAIEHGRMIGGDRSKWLWPPV